MISLLQALSTTMGCLRGQFPVGFGAGRADVAGCAACHCSACQIAFSSTCQPGLISGWTYLTDNVAFLDHCIQLWTVYGVSSIESDECGGKVNAGQEASCGLVVAGTVHDSFTSY